MNWKTLQSEADELLKLAIQNHLQLQQQAQQLQTLEQELDSFHVEKQKPAQPKNGWRASKKD